jgi:hypothetical protein
MSLHIISVYKEPGNDLNAPNEHAKGLLVAHLHQQRANKEAQALTVPNLVVIQAEALQHAAQHFLAFSFGVLEHLHAGETPP